MRVGRPLNDENATADKTESSQGPIAPVKVVPVKKGTLAEEITVYGTIVPAAGAVQTITVPFESRVRRILVTEGQQDIARRSSGGNRTESRDQPPNSTSA